MKKKIQTKNNILKDEPKIYVWLVEFDCRSVLIIHLIEVQKLFWGYSKIFSKMSCSKYRKQNVFTILEIFSSTSE